MKFSRNIGLLALAASLWALQTACDDQYRPVANPIVTPGGQPQTTHLAWVVNFNPNGAGTTTEINVSGDTNVAVNSMGNGSIAEAFPPSSLALFVANRDNDTVSEYLPTLASAITTVSLLSGSHPVYLNSAEDGVMFVLNSGANSACPNGGSVSSIPVSTLSVSFTTCTGPHPTIMAQSSSNDYIYVVNGDGSISVLSPSGPALVGTIAPPIGQTPVYVTASVDGSYIFAVTQGGSGSAGTLQIIAAGATSVAASLPLGMQPTFAVVDPTLNRLYVTNKGDNTVSVFDTSNVNPSSSTPIPLLATVTVGSGPIGVTPLQSGTLFYVANAGSNDVTVVSANSFSPLATVALPVGANPVFIASDPTSSKVYIADQGTSETSIIQTSNNTLTQNIAAPAQQQPVMIVTE